jgi:hypothetical protein
MSGQAGNGAASGDIRDLVPFSWFARVGLPLLGWLLLLGAAVVATAAAIELAGSTRDAPAWLAGALFSLAAVVTVLTPAAFLWRVPNAVARHPWLVGGLTLAALIVVARTVLLWLGPGAAELRAVVQPVIGWLAVPVPLLIGVGLLRFREPARRRPLLFIVLALIYAAFPVVPFVFNQAVSADPISLAVAISAAALSAFAVWVAASAWLDGDRPRAFWALLALALPLFVVGLAGYVAIMAAPDAQAMAGLQPLVFFAAAATSATTALLALIAYGAFAPRH